jgi:hypothetical protein
MANLSEVMRLLPPERQKSARNLAFYTLQWLPLVASQANVKATTSTQDASDFVAMGMIAYATTNAAPPVENVSPQATLLLSIGDASFMPDNNPLHIATFNASAGYRKGFEFPFPVWIQRNTTLTGFLTNLTAVDIMVRIHLYGVRVFDYAAGTRNL